MTLDGNDGNVSRWGTINDRRSSKDRIIREVLAPYVCNVTNSDWRILSMSAFASKGLRRTSCGCLVLERIHSTGRKKSSSKVDDFSPRVFSIVLTKSLVTQILGKAYRPDVLTKVLNVVCKRQETAGMMASDLRGVTPIETR